jgi:hypothetical protein
LTVAGTPLAQIMGMASGATPFGSRDEQPGGAASGPASVLLYGDGFGAIALAQTATTPDIEKQLEQLQQTSQIFEKITVGGVEAQVVGTPLGGAVVWQQGDTTLIAGGMVPMDDLKAFASSVR